MDLYYHLERCKFPYCSCIHCHGYSCTLPKGGICHREVEDKLKHDTRQRTFKNENNIKQVQIKNEQLKSTNDTLKQYLLQIPEIKLQMKKDLLHHIKYCEKESYSPMLVKMELEKIRALSNDYLVELVMQKKFNEAREYVDKLIYIEPTMEEIINDIISACKNTILGRKDFFNFGKDNNLTLKISKEYNYDEDDSYTFDIFVDKDDEHFCCVFEITISKLRDALIEIWNL